VRILWEDSTNSWREVRVSGKKSIDLYAIHMNETSTEQMDASQVFCRNEKCMARGHVGQGTIVRQGKVRWRYRCYTCGKTFSAQVGTMFGDGLIPHALAHMTQ
jgi:transposase-like protein